MWQKNEKLLNPLLKFGWGEREREERKRRDNIRFLPSHRLSKYAGKSFPNADVAASKTYTFRSQQGSLGTYRDSGIWVAFGAYEMKVKMKWVASIFDIQEWSFSKLHDI